MADKSKIEWLRGGSTWNPIRAELLEDICDEHGKLLVPKGTVGWFCIRKSPGCKGCYACAMNLWRGNGLDYSVPNISKVRIFLDEKTLLKPLKWKEPRLIFPCSMTDWMDDFVPDDFRDKMLAVMAMTPQHTYLTLTKCADLQRKYFSRFGDSVEGWVEALSNVRGDDGEYLWSENADCRIHNAIYGNMGEGLNVGWPLRNLWLGTSAESQPYADSRIPELLQTPAAVRWVSAEPLLGPLSFRWAAWDHHQPHPRRKEQLAPVERSGRLIAGSVDHLDGLRMLDWVVAGGESGPKARPMHPDWVRSLRDQCIAAGVPFFFKQWGEWRESFPDRSAGFLTRHTFSELGEKAHVSVYRYGKKAAGRLLDGREWNEYPTRTGIETPNRRKERV